MQAQQQIYVFLSLSCFEAKLLAGPGWKPRLGALRRTDRVGELRLPGYAYWLLHATPGFLVRVLDRGDDFRCYDGKGEQRIRGCQQQDRWTDGAGVWGAWGQDADCRNVSTCDVHRRKGLKGCEARFRVRGVPNLINFTLSMLYAKAGENDPDSDGLMSLVRAPFVRVDWYLDIHSM